MELSEQQNRFFDTFGYLVFPGAMAAEMPWITQEFEAVLARRDIRFDSGSGKVIVPFIDQSERLATLLDHPVVNGILTGVLGEEFNYLSGDGRYYSGDTGWHRDGEWPRERFVKLAFYLDPLRRDSGAIRVIPGSHNITGDRGGVGGDAGRSMEIWDIEGRDVPCVALESNPGDLVVFNHNLFHASFGGKTGRRMFTLNCGQRATAPADFEALKTYIAGHMSSWGPEPFGGAMLRTATPARMGHLQQVLDNASHLPGLYAERQKKKSV